MGKVTDRFKTGHLWLGNIQISSKEYFEYFNQDDYDYSRFFSDIGIKNEYDEDFIIIFDLLSKPVILDELLPEIPLRNEQEYIKVTEKCNELKLTKFNTFVFYSDPSLIIPTDKNYNGLIYIGNFNAEYYD